jgi:hypothetical protein
MLRHTSTSVILEAGESVITLARWLGHSSPTITLDYYAHFMPEAGGEGRGAIDASLGQPAAATGRVAPSTAARRALPYVVVMTSGNLFVSRSGPRTAPRQLHLDCGVLHEVLGQGRGDRRRHLDAPRPSPDARSTSRFHGGVRPAPLARRPHSGRSSSINELIRHHPRSASAQAFRRRPRVRRSSKPPRTGRSFRLAQGGSVGRRPHHG